MASAFTTAELLPALSAPAARRRASSADVPDASGDSSMDRRARAAAAVKAANSRAAFSAANGGSNYPAEQEPPKVPPSQVAPDGSRSRGRMHMQRFQSEREQEAGQVDGLPQLGIGTIRETREIVSP